MLYNLEKDQDIPQPSQAQIDAFLEAIALPSLSPSQLADLNKPFTTKEIMEVVESLPLHKAPGVDNLPAEYYCCYRFELPCFWCLCATPSKWGLPSPLKFGKQ